MIKRRIFFMAKLLIVGCLIGIVFGFFGGLRVGKISEDDIKRWGRKLDESPVRSITINIDPSQQDLLFVQLKKFSDAWRYAVLITPEDPNNGDVNIQMWRYDMKLTGSYSTNTGILKFEFYNTDPVKRVPWWFFDSEIGYLKKLINEIRSSTFSVEY